MLPLFAEGINYDELDAKKPEELTEEEKIALLGRPRLGDVTKIQIRIKESKEFKVISTLYQPARNRPHLLRSDFPSRQSNFLYCPNSGQKRLQVQ